MAGLQTLAAAKAQKYGIPVPLFTALIKQESGWNPSARSPVGAQGLTQLMPGTARGLGVTNAYDPAQNLEGGAKYLSQQYKRFGSWEKALAAYNAGPGNVGRYQRIPETRNYVRNILAKSGNVSGASPGAVSVPPSAAVASSQGGGADFSQINAAKLQGNLQQYLSAPITRGQKITETPLAGVNRQIESIAARGAAAAASVTGAIGTNANPSPALKGSAPAVQAALGVKGTPYSWGGGTPAGPSKGFGRGAGTTGFDCSSLVQYAWAKQGVRLPRTTYQQIKVGRAIPSIQQAQPGDLIFPHAGHVQLYIGNGKVIEAPFTGGQVRVVPVGRVMTIRRPVG